jgi:hypothetical protein
LDIEHAQFVAFWSGPTTLEEVAGLGRSTRHQSRPPCIHDRDWHMKDFLPPGQRLGDIPLPEGPSGLETMPSVSSASAWLAAVRVRVALGHACSRSRCCQGKSLAR